MPTATGPFAVTAARLRGLGSPLDLITANSTSNNASVLLGNGDGSLAAPAVQAFGGGSPLDVVAADFTGDGKTDVALANSGLNSVSVLSGTGDGGFGAGATTFPTQSNPQRIIAGDFNGDAKVDIVVAGSPVIGAGSVRLYANNGSGAFPTFSTLATTGSRPFAVTAADLNGDSKLDLAVGYLAPVSPSVQVFVGQGDGTFQPPVNGSAGTDPRSLQARDVSGDGKLDLVVANFGSNDVSVLKGAGDGTFSAPVNVVVGTQPFSVALGDFDKDGDLDLVTANVGSNNLSVAFNNGDGTFDTSTTVAPTLVVPPSPTPRSVLAEDMNGDGYADIQVANTGSNNVSVLMNGSTTTRVTSSKNPAAQGEEVTFSVTVSGAGQLTGAIHLNDGDTRLATRALTNGTAEVKRIFLAGTHVITVSYTGDLDHAESSATLEQIILAPSTTTSTTSTPTLATTPPTTTPTSPVTTTTLPSTAAGGAGPGSGAPVMAGAGSPLAGSGPAAGQARAGPALARTGTSTVNLGLFALMLIAVGLALCRRRAPDEPAPTTSS